MRLKDMLVTMLGGHTSDEYAAVITERDDVAAKYASLTYRSNAQALELQELKDRLSCMHVTPIGSDMVVDEMMAYYVDDSVLQEQAERHFAEDLGNYLVDNGLVGITSHRDSHGDLVFQAKISVIDERYVEEEK